MRVVLINPPLTVEEVYGKYSDLASFQPPIGLCSLAAYVRGRGHKAVEILDANVLNMGVGSVLEDLTASPPELVGFYCNTANYYVVQHLSAKIRELLPRCKIVLGGPHPSVLPEETLRETVADVCVIGEGELTFCEVLERFASGSDDLSDVPGVAFRSGDVVTMTAPRARIDDLDTLPFPAVDLLPDIRRYKLYLLQHKRLPYMTIMTSRGCPHRCVFCETPFGRAVRFHSPEYMVDYIAWLIRDFGVKELHFCDDTFTLDEDRITRLCDEIVRRRLDVTWYAATRARVKDRTLFRNMKRAGCWVVAIGVESGDEGVLRLMGKHIRIDEVRDCCALVRESGLRLKTFFIIGSPGETLETIERTIRFAISLKPDLPVFSLMTPFPGTPLWANATQYGTFRYRSYNDLHIANENPVFVPHGLTKEILLQKQKEAFRRVYLNGGMVWRQLRAVESFADFVKLVRAFGTFLHL